MAILYIVATPIGHLKDISLRALQVLRGVDLILCEDTRVTKKLLEHYQIKKPLLSYHRHSKIKKVNYILDLLRGGKSLALVSDAGTPGISDPGGKLVAEVIKVLNERVKIVPVPGASAVTAAASISGFPMDKFLFLGFPPTKRKRKKFFDQVLNSKYPVIFYESPYRIIKTLEELKLAIKDKRQKTRIVVCRELTKIFEEVLCGTADEVLEKLKKKEVRGEFVVIVAPSD